MGSEPPSPRPNSSFSSPDPSSSLLNPASTYIWAQIPTELSNSLQTELIYGLDEDNVQQRLLDHG
ncbi:MAG: hypothetical protein E4G98_06840, partial [Promethearchaeota archaeon]